MAEAFFSLVIQELDSWRLGLPDCYDYYTNARRENWGSIYIQNVTDELREILDFLRGKKLEEGSRLNYAVRDAIELAQDALDIKKRGITNNLIFVGIEGDLRRVKNHMFRLKESSIIRSENIDRGDDDGDVVGLDEDVELLLRREILNEAQSFQTLLISGMTGVGKTALARQLYNHVDVVARFERRAWVCVSELSFREILMKLMQQVVDKDEFERDSLFEKMERASNADLRCMLHQHLQGRHYLIVFDNVPKGMYFESIMNAFPYKDAKDCRLLLTSCTKDDKLSRFGLPLTLPFFPYEMKNLDSNKSWQLFLKTLFCGNKFANHEGTFPKNLEKKGREVLMETCGGLPLAIKEVGKQLAEKRLSGCEWEDLFESIDLGSTLKLMEPTYHRLSPEMKSYFLHFALFKDNTNIRLQKTTHIFSVVGFDESRISYDLHCLYLESIIELNKQWKFEKAKSYHMNLVLHMLSVEKAKEEIGFEIVSNKVNIPPSQSPRHRAIYCSREKFTYSTNQDKHLVSLLFRGGGCFDSSPSYWKSLEQLKILDFEDFGLKVLPEGIGMLVELRFLGLRNNYIQELPNSLGCLKKLEVLDIALNLMVEVPNVIWEMGSLRHLYMSYVICRMPLKIDALRNLRTLAYISIDNWTYEPTGLEMMTRLEKLGIENFMDGNLDVSKLFASLAKLSPLRCLYLRGSRFRSMPCDQIGILHNIYELKLDGLLARLPSANDLPPNISILKLVNSCLDEDPMPVLGKLTFLTHLKLCNAYTGQQMVILHNGFPNLSSLCIKELWNLRNVEVGKDALRCLGRLEIKNCPHLETLPKEIGSLYYLKELEMVTTKRIATKINKSGSIANIKLVDVSP